MKKILITGARSGIASSYIDYIKDRDYLIYATTHKELESKRLKEKYKNYKNKISFKLDITKEEDRDKIKDLDIDVIILNAAISNGGSLMEIDISKVKENFEVNVFSNLILIQKYIKNRYIKGGKIIIMSSLAGIIPLPFVGSYCATKASLIKFAEVLRKELSLVNKKINISLIEPGIYKTGFNEFMFMNKYDNNDLYFRNVLDKIEKQEDLLINVLAKKSILSIVKKIDKAVISNNPKLIYRAPLLQVIGAKIYSLFKE